jgi:cytochrome c oxidase subunit 2
MAALFTLIAPRVANCDSATPWQLGFQDPASPIAEGIIHFHHDIRIIRLAVVTFVGWRRFRCFRHFNAEANPVPSTVVHGTVIEIVWTLIPALILVGVAVPSFALLYAVDEIIDPALTLKIVGHQWYWSYEYSDYEGSSDEGIQFDSYRVTDADLEEGNLRLLEVDNRVVLPVDTHVRLIVTAADVLHCWTVPSFGVKRDACPGRLNQASVFVKREGVFYGQCSEICGVNHGFRPIAVDVVSLAGYVDWVSAQTSA